MKKISLIICVTAVACCAMLLSSCMKAKKGDPVVIWLIGSVNIEGADGQSRQAQVKDLLKPTDTIVTGEKSHTTIQLGETAIFKIEENTACKINTIGEKKSLSMDKGMVVAKFQKLSRNERIVIQTPTAVAAIRGTEFSVRIGEKKTTVAVLSGKVEVTDTRNSEQVVLQESKAVELPNELPQEQEKAKLEERPITKIEELEIRKVAIIQPIADIDSKPETEYKPIEESMQAKEEEINQQIEKLKVPQSLEQIKAEYGRVDEVILYSGKRYTGVILSRGGTYKILTLTGEVTVPARDVQNTRVVK